MTRDEYNCQVTMRIVVIVVEVCMIVLVVALWP